MTQKLRPLWIGGGGMIRQPSWLVLELETNLRGDASCARAHGISTLLSLGGERDEYDDAEFSTAPTEAILVM